MAYTIVSSDAHKMVLERESVKLATGMFVGVGAFFFLVGVGLNFFMTTWEMPFLLFRILFPLFGLIAIFAGLYLPKQTESTHPERITFDHTKGAVIVEMKKASNQCGYIRYDEIAGYDIYVESRKSSGSGSSPSRTYYRYHVYVKKKDGGEWHLFEFGDRAAAEAVVNQLTTQIPLHKPFTVTETPKLSTKIEKKDGLDKTMIHWQNRIGLGQPLFLIFFSIIFFSIISAFFSFEKDAGLNVFFMIVLGFILFVFCLVMFSVVRKLVKDATTRYAVSVDHKNLEYYEFSKKSGQMRNKLTIPLLQIKSINYTFSPSQNLGAGLKILTQSDIDRMTQYQNKPVESLKDFFKGVDGPITLSISALNPVECLQLENWLQMLILKKGNIIVQ